MVVTGFTPEMIGDPKIRKDIYDLWIDKGLVVFKDLSGLETHIKLSEIFGEPEEHPLLRGVDVEVADGAFGIRSAIEEQVTTGVAVRMAVLYLLMGAQGAPASEG